MDRVEIRQKALAAFRKYKFVLLILAIGLVLMRLPDGNVPETPVGETEPPAVQEDLETRLARILSQIDGVGKVQVLLTERSGAETVYQTDEDRAGEGGVRIETVIVSGPDRAEGGLVRTVTPPQYLGAVIVCQGGGDPTVALRVVQAVAGATGIGTDRITVLKMK